MIRRVMVEGMAMTTWDVTPAGRESFALSGAPVEFERYTVRASGPDRYLDEMTMYLRTQIVGDEQAVLFITGANRSFDRPQTRENLDGFLAALPAI